MATKERKFTSYAEYCLWKATHKEESQTPLKQSEVGLSEKIVGSKKPDDSFCDAECDCDMCINEYAEREQLKEEKQKLENPEPLPELERYDVDSDRAIKCIPVMYVCKDGLWTPSESVKAREKAIAKKLRECVIDEYNINVGFDLNKFEKLIEELEKVK